MKEKIGEVADLLREWQNKTRNAKGLELTDEENKELAILMVNLEGGTMNDGSEDFWENHYEVEATDEDFYIFYENRGTIWISWNALGDGPIDDEPAEWVERALELIKLKTTK